MDSYACDVVFDTGPVRDLAHVKVTPAWVATFANMRQDGFRFSLADHAFGELLGQRARGSIEDPGFDMMVERLELFIDPDRPVISGGHDIFAALKQGSSAADCNDLSQEAWRHLRTQATVGRDIADPLLEEDRQAWISLFEEKVTPIYLRFRDNAVRDGLAFQLDELGDPILQNLFDSFEANDCAHPSLSTRLDLLIRYFWRQFVRSLKEKEPYDIRAKNNRNDGIDFLLYTFLALPALAVATERGFHKAIENIPSFQRFWILTPNDLADRWSDGNLVLPTWPAETK